MNKKIYIIAGEASGDFIGAKLLEQLQKIYPLDLEIKGIGGHLMAQQGLKSLFPISQIAIMGLVEVLSKIFHIKKLINQTVADIIKFSPDIIITIDSLGFNKRVIEKVKSPNKLKHTKYVHYVAPTVWAWKPHRVKEIEKLYDYLFCLFEFELSYFRSDTLKALDVGHPIVESGADKGNAVKFLVKYNNINNDNKSILLMPGSRLTEVSRLLPIFKEVLLKLESRLSAFNVLVPTVPHLYEFVNEFIVKNKLKWICFTDNEDKYNSYKVVDLAIIASGTASLELSLVKNLPIIVAYKVNYITSLIAKCLIKVKFASIINIIAKHEIIKEFIQDKCTVNHIYNEALLALNNKNYYRLDDQIQIEHILTSMGYNSFVPSQKAAKIIESILENKEV